MVTSQNGHCVSPQITHSEPNAFYWPPIRRGSCDNLPCRNPPCTALLARLTSKCVCVFKIINRKWIYIGVRRKVFFDHLICGCKVCADILRRHLCINTRACPNSDAPNSFCYWTTKCECCTPVSCQPDSGQIFDPTTCQCVCPEGSVMNSAGNCTGE